MSEDKQPQFELNTPEPKRRGSVKFVLDNLVTGVLVTAPAFITLIVLTTLIKTLDRLLLGIIPIQYRDTLTMEGSIPGVGLLSGILLFFLIGIFARNIMGRRLVMWWDSLIANIPGVRWIYSAVKQILETLSKAGSDSFREVVLVEFPRKGIYSIGFLTGKTKGQIQRITDDEILNVFLPTTPNPTNGFMLFVPKSELIKLDMTVDQGLKMVISAGMVTPTMAEGKAALKEAAKAKEAEDKPAKKG